MTNNTIRSFLGKNNDFLIKNPVKIAAVSISIMKNFGVDEGSPSPIQTVKGMRKINTAINFWIFPCEINVELDKLISFFYIISIFSINRIT